MTSSTSKPTTVNEALVGLSYPPGQPYRVTCAKIQEFAEATGATSPLHFDRDAARASGFREVVAPPTFAVVVAQIAEAAYIEDPEAGIDFSRVVHAEQSFEHFRPIIGGDELSTTLHVQSVVHRGPLTFVTTRAEIEDEAGRAVSTVISTLAVRGESA